MANEKVFQSRIQLKHDIEENWSKATNFIPKVGEIIIYDIDENNSIARFKIGDGITNVNSLPFVSHHEVISYLPQELTEEEKAQARENIGAGEPQIQADWNQSDETALDYIKNRTHYDDTIHTLRTREDITSLLNDMGIIYGHSEAEIIPGITFRVIVDGVVYDDVPIWSGCYSAGGDTWGIGDCYTNRGGETWHSTDYGFCFTKYRATFNQEKFPNGVESIEVYTTSKEIKYLDPKFIKDMYYEKEIAKDISNLTYKIEPINYDGTEAVHSLNIPFELGQIWNIVGYDGTIMYENVEVQQTEDGTLYLGSPDVANYPFFVTANTTKVNSGWARNFLNASYFNIVGATRGEVEIHQIDEKYIPDTIARVLDEDDALELAVELGLVEPTTDESGNVFTDENGALYSL